LDLGILEGVLMASILVHLTHGPEHPTRAALAFHVAKASVEAGHRTTVFLAGDAVQLLREEVLDRLNGFGTGNLRNCFDVVAASGEAIYYSAMSARSRGLGDSDLEGKTVKPGSPADLVALSLEHDRMFTY